MTSSAAAWRAVSAAPVDKRRCRRVAWVQGSLKDFEMFYPLMNDPFIISIHDTRNAYGYADGGADMGSSTLAARLQEGSALVWCWPPGCLCTGDRACDKLRGTALRRPG